MVIGFIGGGSWGTALALHMAEAGHSIRFWAHGVQQRELLRSERRNNRYLPDIPFPDALHIVETPAQAAESADLIVIATPTQFIRTTLADLDPSGFKRKTIVNVSKGIERVSLLRISQLLESEYGVSRKQYVCLSGPSHAEEVARKIPTTIVAASESGSAADKVQELFSTDWLRVYTNDDVVGVELGGALKNVIAVCAGVLDGLGLGDNTKAGLITRGLAEITRLGIAMKAKPGTFSGLSGLGDLVVTCTSRHSRNRYVGEQIGQGRRLSEIAAGMTMVAEGVATTESAYQLATRLNVEMPITTQMYQMLFDDKNAHEAIAELMTRGKKHEIWA